RPSAMVAPRLALASISSSPKMSEYRLVEVDGVEFSDRIHAFNALESYFPALREHHLSDGYWWFVEDSQGNHVAFAGMVPFEPFKNVAYLKRCYVMSE